MFHFRPLDQGQRKNTELSVIQSSHLLIEKWLTCIIPAIKLLLTILVPIANKQTVITLMAKQTSILTVHVLFKASG